MDHLSIEKTFDDTEWTDQRVHGFTSQWTQVCEEHVALAKTFGQLDEEGSGICGVLGCHKAAEHYLDFTEVTS